MVYAWNYKDISRYTTYCIMIDMKVLTPRKITILLGATIAVLLGLAALYFSPVGEKLRLAQRAQSYIGLSAPEAQEKAAEEDLEYRVIKENGEDLNVFSDFKPNRINVELNDNTVQDAKFDQMYQD